MNGKILVACDSCNGFGGFDRGGGNSVDCGYCNGAGVVSPNSDHIFLTNSDILSIKGDIKYHLLKDDGLI